ncbi:uncharacterized protein MYCFIDRAFT_174517 [Pseudocercospora fijiensis CIRAD86]|uniref:Uncharacterized protein n=1 Tax=Pseudocercospora fijiensis (strain CIRAD86) TaxID=383855 RepID=M3B0U4_PSEFD|nr:uncharacterized protein MYCFIDRAFT_174517 [Pseudocercospora fijiensis CIRAD86]EME83023.1 hypothetical protein MYCFIDRAFT_174517 [Pseudocercospora fijiensis CIRAD86]
MASISASLSSKRINLYRNVIAALPTSLATDDHMHSNQKRLACLEELGNLLRTGHMASECRRLAMLANAGESDESAGRSSAFSRSSNAWEY